VKAWKETLPAIWFSKARREIFNPMMATAGHITIAEVEGARSHWPIRPQRNSHTGDFCAPDISGNKL